MSALAHAGTRTSAHAGTRTSAHAGSRTCRHSHVRTCRHSHASTYRHSEARTPAHAGTHARTRPHMPALARLHMQAFSISRSPSISQSFSEPHKSDSEPRTYTEARPSDPSHPTLTNDGEKTVYTMEQDLHIRLRGACTMCMGASRRRSWQRMKAGLRFPLPVRTNTVSVLEYLWNLKTFKI